MSLCYYDNSEITDKPVNLIDRVYCLDFHQFNKETWNKLGEIYSILPSQVIINNIGQAAWFGEEGKSDNYLWASVEPSGLQVAGKLLTSDWKDWEGKFNELIIDFPFFEC
ncbi:hypothetical protein [Paenibacillus harenae]|uniref:Uncharacterized protein n=1 Tax=Paenibacillus harenae TaxID=306543 RepID=A0ABT9TYM6_PAEHA|nr:hypothetical protein [Paenibacillus harenae]MDQ0060003.1 hypothetical protein [Paenibacillus harenae]MDQ0112446.1 hypothetical protein [Paenibacillus harenae]